MAQATSPTPPIVAGYQVEDLVGFGGAGEVWRARDILTGRLVALKRLHHDGPPAERDRLRREAAILSGLASPHIVRLLTVLTCASGLVLVLDFQGGGSLAGLLRARPRLAPGEVVTMAAPLAAALAEVHAAGLVHGDVSPANVLFATDGRPVLSDLGVARLSGLTGPDAVTAAYADPAVLVGAPLDRASDVYALAAVCHEALSGQPPYPGLDADTVVQAAGRPRQPLAALAPSVPPALAAVVEAALCADPEQRPDAASFAARLLEACPALPVRLAGASVAVASTPTAAVRRLPEAPSTAEPTPSRPERLAAVFARVRLSPRRLMLAAATPLAIAAAVWGGVAWARSSSGTTLSPATWAVPATLSPSPASTNTAIQAPAQPGRSRGLLATALPLPAAAATPAPVAGAATGFQRVLATLDARRDSAFVAGEAALLDQVYAAGSAPLALDDERLTAMVAAGEHATGLALQLRSVQVLSADASSARLRVSDQLGPYALVGPDGQIVARLPSRALTTWSISLVRTAPGDDGWRIATISRA